MSLRSTPVVQRVRGTMGPGARHERRGAPPSAALGLQPPLTAAAAARRPRPPQRLAARATEAGNGTGARRCIVGAPRAAGAAAWPAGRGAQGSADPGALALPAPRPARQSQADVARGRASLTDPGPRLASVSLCGLPGKPDALSRGQGKGTRARALAPSIARPPGLGLCEAFPQEWLCDSASPLSAGWLERGRGTGREPGE